jgi:hypothetical protein
MSHRKPIVQAINRKLNTKRKENKRGKNKRVTIKRVE